MFTTMVIGLGFAVLSFSDYLGMAKVGFFGSIAIFVALLCDLLLIPAMIIIFKPKFGVKNADTTIDYQGAAI
jgi:predicted RND superfamily exporter protein